MVTKRNTKKHKVFSKKNTKKNYYGGVSGPVTGTEEPNWKAVYTENMKKLRMSGIKLSSEIVSKALREARETSGYNKWLEQNYPQSTSDSVISSQAPESTSVSPEIQIPSLVNEDLFNKALASNVDFLIEQSLQSNEFAYILEKQTEKQTEQQANVKQSEKLTEQRTQEQANKSSSDYAKILNDSLKSNTNPNFLKRKEFEYEEIIGKNYGFNTPIPAITGGSKYFEYGYENKPIKTWIKIFKKYKELQNVFYKTEDDDERRSDVVKRFNLYLEMMDFYKYVTDNLEVLKNQTGTERAREILQNYYTKLNPEENSAINDNDIATKVFNITIIQGNDEKKGNAKEGVFFVRFVLFNDSIINLFTEKKQLATYAPEERAARVAEGRPIIENDEKKVKVNIFQLNTTSGLIYGSYDRQSAKDTNTILTTAIPKRALPSAGFDPSNFYTQFKTFEWSLKFIDDNFFKDTRRTGDNMSVLVRSTILYVIAKIFNDTNVKNFINGSDINKYYSTSSRVEFARILRTAFPSVSVGFLSELANSYLPISYQQEGLVKSIFRTFGVTADVNKEWTNQLNQIKNFITASKYKKNEDEIKKEMENLPEKFGLDEMTEDVINEFDDTKCAIPYNIFVNLYKRSDDPDKLFLTNIPDNVINSEALSFINSLELFLTNNKYLSETTKTTIKKEFTKREDYKNTKNIFHTSNDISSSPLEYIEVENHINPKAIESQITEFDSHTIQELKLDTIKADIKVTSMPIQSNPFDFKKNLEESKGTFNSPCCNLNTHITELGGPETTTIDCQRACLMSQLVYENTKVVRLFDFENCWGRNETRREETIQVDDSKTFGVKKDIIVKRGLKYLCAYQPDYQYGAYTNDITANKNEINRFNNVPYVKREADNLQLTNYNYVEHKCHVWVDDALKRVYVVFRGTISSHDWYITDIGIAAGFGFQEGRLLQIKEILRDVYRQLNSYALKEYGKPDPDDPKKPIFTGDDRQDYKVIFAGHSLGGFLSIMSSVMVFNNEIFKYKNTFQNAISITFNPWFPPEAIPSRSQGVLDSYIPLINYGTTCALAFGICGDAAQRTLIPSCSSSIEGFEEEDEDSFEVMRENPLARGIRTTVDALSKSCGIANINPVYFNQVKGPFYYYLVDSWATTSIKNVAPRHSVHNFFGVEIQKKLLDFATNYVSLYNDLPENINKKNNYLDMLFSELNKPENNRRCLRAIPLLGIQVPGSQLTQPSQSSSLTCGLNVTTNIVLGGNYRLPVSPAIPFNSGMINLNPRDAIKSNVTVTVNPSINNVPDTPSLGGKKYKTVVKKTSKKLRKRRSKRTTKKLRR
jgi:hypothetical protein